MQPSGNATRIDVQVHQFGAAQTERKHHHEDRQGSRCALGAPPSREGAPLRAGSEISVRSIDHYHACGEGAISNLWRTAYGNLLLLRTGLVAGISVCGYINWQRLRKLHEKSGASIVVLEATLAGAVGIVTGFLTETGHP